MTGELRNLVGTTGAVRTTRYHGRDHLVIPVVALMDGVIHAVNAPSAERVTADTLTHAAKSWEGKPLCYGHPVRGGRQISAAEDGVADAYVFGTIRNSRMSGSKLLMDAYADPVRAEKLGGAEFLRRLQTGIPPFDVSVGAFVSVDHTPGTFNGREYKATWRETVGDHLAVLTNRGACDQNMGCGTHRASEAYMEPRSADDATLITALTALLKSIYTMYATAHTAHWNIEGPLFPELHSFFGDIYDDVFDSADPVAEAIRQHGAYVPSELIGSITPPALVGGDPKPMVAALALQNTAVMAALNTALAAVDGDEGLANLIQDRLMHHNKYEWQLSAQMKAAGRSRLAAAFDKDAPVESRTLAQRLLGLLKFRSAAQSFTDVQDSLEDALRKVVPNFLCVDSVYTDDTVVYMVGSAIAGAEPDDMTLMRRSFSTAKDGSVTLADDAEEVEAVTTYEPRDASNPEGINQYSKNGGGHDEAAKAHEAAARAHDAAAKKKDSFQLSTGWNSKTNESLPHAVHSKDAIAASFRAINKSSVAVGSDGVQDSQASMHAFTLGNIDTHSGAAAFHREVAGYHRKMSASLKNAEARDLSNPEGINQYTKGGGAAAAHEELRGRLQLLKNETLKQVVAGKIDLNQRAAHELGNRGLDQNAKWVGFDKAHQIHGTNPADGGIDGNPDPHQEDARGHLQVPSGDALGHVVRGNIDLNKMAAHEMASRGLNKDAKWVGFTKAKVIHNAEGAVERSAAAPKMQDCELCDGTGQVDSADCKACDGTGEVPFKAAEENKMAEQRSAGGPGSGWTAENGHVPGGTGGKGGGTNSESKPKVGKYDGQNLKGARIKAGDFVRVDVGGHPLMDRKGVVVKTKLNGHTYGATGVDGKSSGTGKSGVMVKFSNGKKQLFDPYELRSAAKMTDCHVCDGTGEVDDEECELCGGAGKVPMKAYMAAEDHAAAVAATNDDKAAHGGDKESGMSKDERAAAIKALTECPCSGFDTTHLKMLEAATDEQITAFAERGKTIKAAQDAVKAAAAGECSTCKGEGKMFGKECADCGGTGKTKEPKAAEAKPMTAEEFLKVAPEEIRSLVARQKKADAAEKKGLVGALVAAQDAYSETDLQGMAVDELSKLARAVKVDAPDFSGRGVARSAEEADVFTNPPNSYDLAIAARNGKSEKAVN